MGKFEDILYDLNDFGRYQKLRYFLICIAGILPPISTYINSFVLPLPKFKCNSSDDLYDSLNESTSSSSVSLMNLNNQCEYVVNGTVRECTSWLFEKKYYQKTLTEEWGLVCNNALFRSNVQSIYFSGYLVGSALFGALADRFGRRPVMLLSFVILLLGFLGMSLGPQEAYGFMTSYIIYALSRFLMACGTRGINETGYVLALELVSPKKRSHIGIGFEFSFAIGQLILVVLAYFVRDWRILCLIMVFLTVPFLGYVFIIAESPRWLIAQSRQEDAHNIVMQIARENKKKLNEDEWQEFVVDSKNSQTKETFLTLVKSLIKYPMQLVLLCTLFFNWLVNNFVYYGVGLKSIDLGTNPYVSFSISASVEILAFGTVILIINKVGRKKSYFFFLLLAGGSCISSVFIDNVYVSLTVAMVGKYAVSASYAILRLYSNEIFPTSIRNSCIGACSMVSRMGVIIAPFINTLGETTWAPLPFLIFGVMAMLASFSTILLPETLNRKLPENIEDAHYLNSFKNVQSLNVNQNSDEKKNLQEVHA